MEKGPRHRGKDGWPAEQAKQTIDQGVFHIERRRLFPIQVLLYSVFDRSHCGLRQGKGDVPDSWSGRRHWWCLAKPACEPFQDPFQALGFGVAQIMALPLRRNGPCFLVTFHPLEQSKLLQPRFPMAAAGERI